MEFKPTLFLYTVCISYRDECWVTRSDYRAWSLREALTLTCPMTWPPGWCSVISPLGWGILPSSSSHRVLPMAMATSGPAQLCAVRRQCAPEPESHTHSPDPLGVEGEACASPWPCLALSLHFSLLNMQYSMSALSVCEGTQSPCDVQGVISRKFFPFLVCRRMV